MATAEDNTRVGAYRYIPRPSFQSLLATCAGYMDGGSLEVVRRAYRIADRAHSGTFRISGEPYIEHPIAVARWLADREVAADCIAAALLHDVVEDTSVSLDNIRARFGNAVASLVDGVTKFEAVEEPDERDGRDELALIRDRKQRQQAETVRKLLLAMAEDPRVALIKLADRLHNFRTLSAKRPDRQAAIARETLEIYVPLADRLGIAEIKYELQDTALLYLDSQRYACLTEAIAKEVETRAERTNGTCRALVNLLTQYGLDAEVTPHIKHLANINHLLTENEINLHDIGDLVTFLVLVNNRDECYHALRLINSRWQQIDVRMRDYIGSPKLNGYQSLHTTVFGFGGLFDVHIRTHEMQRIADYGPVLIAATNKMPPSDAMSSRESSLRWIQQVQSWQHELSLSASDLVDAVRNDLFRDQIFIFTPKGEVKDLPNGATVLDMAYRIHSDLGNRCVGAKITGGNSIARLESRDYPLHSGEIVRVLTRDQVHPEAEWLQVAQTRHARDAIMQYLHTHHLPIETTPSPEETPVRLGWCCEPAPDDELIAITRGRQMIIHRAGCRYVTTSPPDTGLATAGQPSTPPHQQFHVRWGMLHPKSYRVTLDIMGRDRSGLMFSVAEVLDRNNVNLARGSAHSISSRYKATMWITIDITRPGQLERVIQELQAVDGVVSVKRRQRITTQSEG